MSTDRNEALRLIEIASGYTGLTVDEANQAAALLRQQAERIAELDVARAIDTFGHNVMAGRAQLQMVCLENKLQNVTAERDQLLAEVERLRVDAERYQWLRDCHPADGTLWVAMGLPHAPGGVSCWRDSELDTAIDHARTTHKD